MNSNTQTRYGKKENLDAPEAKGVFPAPTPDEITKEKATLLIGWVLQAGVMVSATVIVIGFLLLLTHAGSISPQQLLAFPHTLPQVVTDLVQLRPQAIIMLGLLLLILTPVLRVAVSILTFMLERDKKFVMITCLVLAILLYSIFFISRIGQDTVPQLLNIQFSFPEAAFIFLGSIIAGLLGSLVGLGGGILVVPLLTIVFKFPISFAIGASIISVIATSSGAAAAYVRDHLTNLRIGMFLEIATTLGAISGAFLAGYLAPNLLSIIFGAILLVSAAPLIIKIGEEIPHGVEDDRLATWFQLASTYPDHRLHRDISYHVTRTPFGFMMMYVAGAISGLLGIGSGTFKVVALDSLMRLPMKVSTTTSNFMIGVTAAASAGIYFSRGDILPLVAAPVALGVLIGALIGARLLAHLSSKALRITFLIVLILSASEMVLNGLGLHRF